MSTAQAIAAALAAPPLEDQPDVPEVEGAYDPITLLLQEDPDAALIGHEDEVKELTPQQIQSMQTQALLQIAQTLQGQNAERERVRQKTIQEIEPVSPWNPTGSRHFTPFRGGGFSQHGIPVNRMMVSEAEVAAINKMKPGRYLDRTVEVSRLSDGTLNITWPNKRIEQRLEFAMKFPTLISICDAVVADRAAKEARRRAGQFDDEEVLG